MTAFDTTAPTLQTVAAWYRIQPAFAHAVLETWAGADYERGIEDIHKLLARYHPQRIQLEYAFSADDRGRHVAGLLTAWGVDLSRGGAGKSYLDIGCAYGGFLVAFANPGFDVTGIELEELYARLGRLNLEANGLRDKIRMGDFLDEGILPVDAKFDLITCNDVIEHVNNPAGCLEKICRMLKPGGVAYIASPNKLSIPNVRADVHFQCFGLTLLDHFRARAAFAMYSGQPNYEVSDFYEPEWYVNTLRNAGSSARVVFDASAPPVDAAAEMAALYTAFANWTKEAALRLDPFLRHEITRELAAYSARMFQAYGESMVQNAPDRFAQRWIDPLTRVLVQMPPYAAVLPPDEIQMASPARPAAPIHAASLPVEPAADARGGKDALHGILDVLQRVTPEPVRAAVRRHYLNHFYFRVYPEKRPRRGDAPDRV